MCQRREDSARRGTHARAIAIVSTHRWALALRPLVVGLCSECKMRQIFMMRYHYSCYIHVFCFVIVTTIVLHDLSPTTTLQVEATVSTFAPDCPRAADVLPKLMAAANALPAVSLVTAVVFSAAAAAADAAAATHDDNTCDRDRDCNCTYGSHSSQLGDSGANLQRRRALRPPLGPMYEKK
jgi:hypothetical protein